MSPDKSEPKPFDSRIPWLIVVPFLAIAAIWMWGFNQYKSEAQQDGSFPVGPGVKTVKIVTDVGNVDVVIGSAGAVGYEVKTLRTTGSEELLQRAVAVPFELQVVPSDDPSILVLRVPPLPEGFVRLPPRSPADEKSTLPRLFRQLNARLTVPVDLAVIVESSCGNIRVDTRQAPTTVAVDKGTLMLLNIAAPLTARNGDGDTMVADQRGALDLQAHGKTRVNFAEVGGDVHIVNDFGETGVYVPAHASIQLEARSETGVVRNGFGFVAEAAGARGQVVRGRLGDGAHKMKLISRSGTLTVTTRSASE